LLSSVDDVRVGRHLREMQTRARDLIQWALYHFVAAFRYEFLMDVPSDIFNIDNLVDAIVKDATVDKDGKPVLDASNKPVTLETISSETYLKSEEKILKDYLLRIAKTLLDRRQIKNAPANREVASPLPLLAREPSPGTSPIPSGSPSLTPPAALPVSLTLPVAAVATVGNISTVPTDAPPVAGPVHAAVAAWVGKTRAWLDTLRRDRVIRLHPVDDLRLVGDYRTRGARIAGINVRDITLAVPANWPRFEFNLRFVHSGVSIIYDTSENGQGFDYFYFGKGPTDDPISWNFRCAWNPKEKKVSHAADTRPGESLIKILLGKGELDLKPYQPGLYSPLTLVLDFSLSDEPDAFPPIQSLDFGVVIEHTGDPPIAARL
jgi:hypothetical protein